MRAYRALAAALAIVGCSQLPDGKVCVVINKNAMSAAFDLNQLSDECTKDESLRCIRHEDTPDQKKWHLVCTCYTKARFDR